MKKLYLLILLVSVFAISNAQEFSFQMFFADAVGHKDTLTFGYDPLGTDSIDSIFGEVNIISLPRDTAFDVRITNEWLRRTQRSPKSPGTFHTKKQINGHVCQFNYWQDLNVVDIHTKYWPVTATWDKSLFLDTCRHGSLFTSITPGGWFDTGSPSDLYTVMQKSIDSVIFTTNAQPKVGENYYYIDNGDTIPVFWQAFDNGSATIVSIEDIPASSRVSIIPNPAINTIEVFLPGYFDVSVQIEVFNAQAQQVLQVTASEIINKLNISDWVSGIYFIRITNNDGKVAFGRFVKE